MFKNILVATDFGAASRRAAETACELAARFNSRLTLLHVWSAPAPTYADALALRMEAITEQAIKSLEEEGARLHDRPPFASVNIQTRFLSGLAWRTIVESVTEIGADLIVIGTHGRRGAERLFLGSVAEKVVRASPVPVLTVHDPGDTRRVEDESASS